MSSHLDQNAVASAIVPDVSATTLPANVPAELADNLKLLDEHVPEGRNNPSPKDCSDWQTATLRMDAVARKAGITARVAARIQFAMGALLYQHTDTNQIDSNFNTDFKRPNSNHEFAPAAAVFYNLNIADTSKTDAPSKRINSKCAQYDGLVRTLVSQGIDIKLLPLDRETVRRLVGIIEEAGGLNALERIKNDDSDGNPTPIAFDREGKAAILKNLGLAALTGGQPGEPRVSVLFTFSDGATKEILLPQSEIDRVIATQAKPPKRTQALAEMLQMGSCVLTYDTDQVKRRGSDPNDTRTELRTDERQDVFHPDGRITQSLREAKKGSVIVECRHHEPHLILGQPVLGHTRLETRMRKRIEANIMPADRRMLFNIAVAPTEMQSAVGKIVVRTEAATGDGKGEFSALLQRLTGNGFTDINPKSLDRRAMCEIGGKVFYGFASAYAANAIKVVQKAPKKRGRTQLVAPEVKITLGKTGFSALCDKADDPAKVVAAQRVEGAADIQVRLDDFVAFLSAYLSVSSEVTSDLVSEIGDRVLVLSFSTANAAYRVFIPASHKGERKDFSIIPLSQEEWPEGASLEPSSDA
jgi:hypothetical protein